MPAGEKQEPCIEYGADKQTLYITPAPWNGWMVQVRSEVLCDGHALEPMDHYGEPGTGYLLCTRCGGTAFEPPSDESFRTPLQAYKQDSKQRWRPCGSEPPTARRPALLSATQAIRPTV